MGIVQVALRRPYMFLVVALVVLLATPVVPWPPLVTIPGTANFLGKLDFRPWRLVQAVDGDSGRDSV